MFLALGFVVAALSSGAAIISEGAVAGPSSSNSSRSGAHFLAPPLLDSRGDFLVRFTTQGGGEIPALAYGTSHLHDPAVFVEALQAGYRHIDTAYKYRNAVEIGEALRLSGVPREDVFLTTKLAYWPDFGIFSPFYWLLSWLGNDMKIDRKGSERAALRRTLDELGVSHADLCLIHSPFAAGMAEFLASYLPQRLGRFMPLPWPPLRILGAPTRWLLDFLAFPFGDGQGDGDAVKGAAARLAAWRALEAARKDGECRYIGVSNYDATLLKELEASEPEVLPAVNQIELHPRFQAKETFRHCQERGIAILAFGASVSRESAAAVPAVATAAAREGVSAAQVVLRWMLQHGVGTIAQSSRPRGMAENLALNFTLSRDEMAALDALEEDDRQPFYYGTASVLGTGGDDGGMPSISHSEARNGEEL